MSVKKLTSFPEFPLWTTKLQGQLNTTTLWKRVVTEQVVVGLFEAIREFIMLYHTLKRLRFTFTPNGKREFVPRDQISVRNDATRSLQLVFTIFTFLTKQPRWNAVVLHFLSLHHFSHTFFKKWIDLFPSSVNKRPVFWKLSTPLEPKRIISVTSYTVQIDKSYHGNDFQEFFLVNRARKPPLSSTVKHSLTPSTWRRSWIRTLLQTAIASAGLSTVCIIVDMTRYCTAVTRSDNSSASLAKASVAFSHEHVRKFII